MASSRPASGLELTSESLQYEAMRADQSRRGGAHICDLLDEIALGIAEGRSLIRSASASEKARGYTERRCPGKVEQLA